MKKLLPLAAAALILLPASVEAKPRYKQFKVMTRSTFGYAYCGWDSSIKDIKKYLANGWEFVSETPMQFQTRGSSFISFSSKNLISVIVFFLFNKFI